jgi:hypothetical protein
MSVSTDYQSSVTIFGAKTLWKGVTRKTKMLIINHKKFRYGESDWVHLTLGEVQWRAFYTAANTFPVTYHVQLTSSVVYWSELALTWPTSGGRSVGIIRLRAKATKFVLSRTIIRIQDSLNTSKNKRYSNVTDSCVVNEHMPAWPTWGWFYMIVGVSVGCKRKLRQ